MSQKEETQLSSDNAHLNDLLRTLAEPKMTCQNKADIGTHACCHTAFNTIVADTFGHCSYVSFCIVSHFFYYDRVRYGSGNAAANGPIVHPPYDTQVNVEQQWKNTDRGKLKDSEKNLSLCHFIHHKSHMDCSGHEPRPPWSDAIN
jgi:hypothetical protein